MAFVQFSQVSLAFGDRDILKNVSVNLQAGSKAALTGANGAGKSTLIKVMAGLVQPDSGSRVAQKDSRISYLPQSGLTHHGCSLREEADKAFAFGYELNEEDLAKLRFSRQALHAAVLEFRHPFTSELLHFESPFPRAEFGF